MAWGFAASALGSLGSGLIGAIASNASARKQFKYQSALQAQAAQLNYDYGIKSLENSPTAQRKGLISAGYNPMLAVQNGTSGANAGWTTTGQATGPDYSGGISSGVSNALNIQNMKNQTAQTEASVDEAYANADKAKAEKNTILQRLPFISQREKAEIANVEKDSMKKEAEIHNIDETTRFIEKEYELRKRLGEMGIDVQRYAADRAYNASTFATKVKAETERGTRTDRLPFGIGSTYYDMRGNNDKFIDWSDEKYWRNHYY